MRKAARGLLLLFAFDAIRTATSTEGAKNPEACLQVRAASVPLRA
jgi:hypothetical protein